MKKKLIAAIVIATSAIPLTPAPSYAHNVPATQQDHIEVRHYAPDSGYDADLVVRCGSQGFHIIEGTSSTRFKNVFLGPDCKGVTSIYLRDNEQWWCKYSGTWRLKFNSNRRRWFTLGEHWTDGSGCTVRRG